MSGAFQVRIMSEPEELGPVRDRIEAWATAAGWQSHEVHDMVLALDEALTNVIRHGYQGQRGHPIELDVTPIRDAKHGAGVEFVIRDYGRQVPLQSICSRNLDDVRPGGLGVHIIRSVMDEAHYEHAPGGGMRLTMRKFHGPPRWEAAAGSAP
jgi:anti-sigma regulatory factor (Ser/Thr protein kinase)